MNKCEFALVSKILESGEKVNIGEQEITVKPLPDCDKTGVMDQREFFIRSAIFAFQKSMPVGFRTGHASGNQDLLPRYVLF